MHCTLRPGRASWIIGKARNLSMASVLLALRPVMSEAPGSTRFDAVPSATDQQAKFVQDNMRRGFLLIYRIVGNVADAPDLTQEAFIKRLHRHSQISDPCKAAH